LWMIFYYIYLFISLSLSCSLLFKGFKIENPMRKKGGRPT
jgi:hypothetical protein